MEASEGIEFIARATEAGGDRPFEATLDLRTFMRRISEAAGTSLGVTTDNNMASAIALRVPVRVTARRPARSLATSGAAPDMVAVACRLVSVDHRNRLRLRSALRGVSRPGFDGGSQST
jgi:hypothetical protein